MLLIQVVLALSFGALIREKLKGLVKPNTIWMCLIETKVLLELYKDLAYKAYRAS